MSTADGNTTSTSTTASLAPLSHPKSVLHPEAQPQPPTITPLSSPSCQIDVDSTHVGQPSSATFPPPAAAAVVTVHSHAPALLYSTPLARLSSRNLHLDSELRMEVPMPLDAWLARHFNILEEKSRKFARWRIDLERAVLGGSRMRTVGYGVYDKLMSGLVHGLKIDMDTDFLRMARQLDAEKGPELRPPKRVALMPIPGFPTCITGSQHEGVDRLGPATHVSDKANAVGGREPVGMLRGGADVSRGRELARGHQQSKDASMDNVPTHHGYTRAWLTRGGESTGVSSSDRLPSLQGEFAHDSGREPLGAAPSSGHLDEVPQHVDNDSS